MRRGFQGNLFLSEDGEFLGINLGADYCAEHEWGLEGLSKDFALDKTAPPGVARHTIRRIPQERFAHLDYIPKERYVGYVGSDNHISREVQSIRDEEEFAGAWSGNDFGVRFKSKEHAEALFKAFLNLDVAFLFLKNENPFARSGLCLMIVSKLDPNVVEAFAKEEAEHDRLLQKVKETGIEERLLQAGRAAAPDRYTYPKPFSYFALSPKWADEAHTTVKFWLNPCDQKNVNYGWFTVEDLDDWIQGKGKVPKNPA